MESNLNNEAIQKAIQLLLESAKPFITISIVLTAVIVIFYIINSVMKMRSQKAILDIRKTLNEMNERQKSNSVSKTPVIKPATEIEAQKTIPE